ncbi:DUF3800 domain-containing protein [Halorussus caseinilyticus]|uniref:DUF3800 domain-containing protein n=1 Tax=Halorussus caseinilyticus TaxID=3034025 RepID=A0ABD5WMU2_9EURY
MCIVLESSNLRALSNLYLLYQDRTFEISWDLAVIALGYSLVLSPIVESANTNLSFTFDRLFGTKQSNQIVQRLGDEHPEIEVQHATSHGTTGIQAADCIAGAVADSYRNGRNWFEGTNVDVNFQTRELLTRMDQLLRDENKTGP